MPASELVPGDLVSSPRAIRLPADGRVIEAARLQVDEASLTGESRRSASRRTRSPTHGAARRSDVHGLHGNERDRRPGPADRHGDREQTEVGKIGVMIEEAGPNSTPLERKLDRLGRTLVGSCSRSVP